MKRFAAHLLGTVFCALIASCNQPLTTEQKIISRIRMMEAHIENGERRQFMSNVAEDFRGQGGRLTRDELRAYVVLQFNRYKNFNAQLFPIMVREITENEATAGFQALITGGPGWIPDQGQLYQFNTHWQLDGDEWMLAAAWWEPLAMGQLMD